MCMAFHPKKPAVIAGGTFSGKWCNGECRCVWREVYSLPACIMEDFVGYLSSKRGGGAWHT